MQLPNALFRQSSVKYMITLLYDFFGHMYKSAIRCSLLYSICFKVTVTHHYRKQGKGILDCWIIHSLNAYIICSVFHFYFSMLKIFCKKKMLSISILVQLVQKESIFNFVRWFLCYSVLVLEVLRIGFVQGADFPLIEKLCRD